VRAFIAIELDAACLDALAAATARLKAVAPGVRWVRPSQQHLTLKFIGELAERDLPAAVECLGEAARSVQPFEMEVAGVSGFPPRGVPRVIHVGVAEPTGALAALHESVEAALADGLGVAREARRYVPHITLGRVQRRRLCPPLDAMRHEAGPPDFGTVTVTSFVLMESDLRPTGAVHTVVHRFVLGA